MESSQKVRFGILGCAKIAWKLARAMLRVRGVSLHAVGSRSMEKAQKFASRLKELDPTCSPVLYGSYDEVLEDADVDAVYIPLPTGLHREWVSKAAARGKHVLLEKPVALSVEDLDEMLRVCDEAGVQIMDGTMWVHSPRAAAIRSILDDAEKFGILKRVNSSFFFLGSEDFMEKDIRVQKGLDEQGCLGDIGWYCIRAALWAKDFQLPSHVAAQPGSVWNAHGVLISCGATLVWPDGVVANFDCGFDAPLRQVLQIAGSRGTVSLEDFTIPHREDVSPFVFEGEAAIVDGGTRTRSEREDVSVYLEKPQEALMVEAFAGIVMKVKEVGRSALVEFWKDCMWKTQRVLLAVKESSEKNGAVIMLA